MIVEEMLITTNIDELLKTFTEFLETVSHMICLGSLSKKRGEQLINDVYKKLFCEGKT